jgi:predicted aspartyl protease
VYKRNGINDEIYSSVQCYQIKRIDCCLMSSEYYFRYIHNDNTHMRGRVGISLTSLSPSHLCACPKPGIGYPTSYVVVPLFVFSELIINRFQYITFYIW